ncbi:MAG: hypothetical protein AB1801_25220 [Chloroflexota bacterium]
MNGVKVTSPRLGQDVAPEIGLASPRSISTPYFWQSSFVPDPVYISTLAITSASENVWPAYPAQR